MNQNPVPIESSGVSKMASANLEVVRPAEKRPRASTIRGLLWAEWFTHSRLLLMFLGLWLAGVWLLPFFADPAWILVLGAAYALMAGPAYGGMDVLEGCEEFSLSLPATRSARFWSRAAVGGGTLLLLTGINLLSLGLDLPQVLTRLSVDTGLLTPRPVMKTGLLYGLVLVLPFTVFSFSFALASVAHSRMVVLTAWFWAGLASMAVLQGGFWCEEAFGNSLTGYAACPLLAVAGVIGLCVGQRLYRVKEVGEPSVPITLPGRWWLWLFIFFLGVAAALALISSLARQYPKFFTH